MQSHFVFLCHLRPPGERPAVILVRARVCWVPSPELTTAWSAGGTDFVAKVGSLHEEGPLKRPSFFFNLFFIERELLYRNLLFSVKPQHESAIGGRDLFEVKLKHIC